MAFHPSKWNVGYIGIYQRSLWNFLDCWRLYRYPVYHGSIKATYLCRKKKYKELSHLYYLIPLH